MISNEESNDKTAENDLNLCEFVPGSILSNNTRGKTISVLGKFPKLSETNEAIVILEKKAFTQEQILGSPNKEANEEEPEQTSATLKQENSIWQLVQNLQKDFVNDIYTNATISLDPSVNTVKTTIIYPATQLHVKKYSRFNLFIVKETWQLFKEITEPFLNSSQFSLEVRICV